jgi:hypothetical protein
MEFELEKVKVMLVTNIPGKEPFPFTNDVLYQPDIKNTERFQKWPSVCTNTNYEKISSKLNGMDYGRRLKFFFDPVSAKKRLVEFGASVNSDEKVNMEANVKIMLKLLFPISYPHPKNTVDSYHRYIEGESGGEISFKGAVPKYVGFLFPGLEVFFSYVRVDGTTYTVTRCVWLNDILNHPEYASLLNEFTDFRKWQGKQKAVLGRDIDNRQLILEKLYNSLFSKSDDDLSIFNEIRDIFEPNPTEPIEKLLEDLLIKIKQHDDIFKRSKITKIISAIAFNCENMARQIVTSERKIPFVNNVKSFFTSFVELLPFLDADEKVLQPSVEDILETLHQLRIYYNIMVSTGYNKISLPSDITRTLTSLFEEADRIIDLKHIQETYFGDDININFQDDSPNIRDTIKSRYPQYEEFMGKIKRYVQPARSSSNDYLQKQIEEYALNVSQKFAETVAEIQKNYLYKRKGGVRSEFMEVGLTTSDTAPKGEPKWEMYVHLDLIKGEANDSNVRKITCNYKGTDLGEMFERLRSGRANPFLVPKMPLIDLDKMLPDAKKEEPKPVAVKQGGKTYKKRRMNRSKTRRNR